MTVRQSFNASRYIGISGTPITGNVPVFSVANGITSVADSGAALVTTMAATTVWSNITGSTAPPSANTVLNLGDGSASAPIYSFLNNPTCGFYRVSSGVIALTMGGNKAVSFGTFSGNYIDMLSNSTPLIRGQGSTNTPLFLAANGTSGIELQSNGGVGNTRIAVFNTTGTAGTNVNFLSVISNVTGAGVTVAAAGTDTDVDLLLSGKGAGLLSFGTRTAIGAETLSGYITIKDAGGTTRKIGIIS